MTKTCRKDFRITDWQGVEYRVEIAFVRFLGGYVAWVDDEPWNEGEPFRHCLDAERTIRRYLA